MIRENTFKIYGNNLNPKIWKSDGTIKTEIREKLLEIADNFYKDLEFNFPYSDILLLGSNANYDWNEFSDIDLHILIDSKKLGINDKYIQPFLDGLKDKWNIKHKITLHDIPVEMYIQNIDDKNAALGIFSLLNNKWIKFPKKQKISFNKEKVKEDFKNITGIINHIINNNELEKGKKLEDKIWEIRKQGLGNRGEFSDGNILFKLLRSSGYIKKLIDFTNKSYDEKESLKEKIIGEGLNDPHIFKAIFMAGIPGAGKTEVSKYIKGGTGLKVVNIDIFNEWYLKNKKAIDFDKFDQLINSQLSTYIQGHLGLIIDKTSSDFDMTLKTKESLELFGYDTAMIFVTADLEIAKQRVINRQKENGREVDTDYIDKVHTALQKSIEKYTKIFKNNLFIIDNTENIDFGRLNKQVNKFINSPVKNPLSKIN